MWKTLTIAVAACVGIIPAGAQPNERRAAMNGGQNPNEGRCTLELVAQGAAELQIRGDSAILRNRTGSPVEWRGFTCSSTLPENAADVRVRLLSGRGTVQLARDSRGGNVILQLDAPQRQAEPLMIELLWTPERQAYSDQPRNGAVGLSGSSISNQRRDIANQQERFAPDFTIDEAISLCEDDVEKQALSRLGAGDVQFRSVRPDTATGHQDWLVGTFAFVKRNSEVAYHFSCMVDFPAGRLRSARIDQIPGDAYAPGNTHVPSPEEAAMSACEDNIQTQIERTGYRNVTLTNTSMDQRGGRSDWVYGRATGARQGRTYRFSFSCRVNLNNGAIVSANVTRR